MIHTPVLFLMFNRPDTTRQVFEAIRKVRPKQLFIAADGPRDNRPDDIEKCRQTREIVSHIDWDCEVKTLFRESNLSCKYAVSEAIDWFFDNVEEGIILEDDTLPDSSFFFFCQELLARYRTDTRIMHIGGANFQLKKKRGNASYYFSNYNHNWGWATWRRAWKHYDVKLTEYHHFVRSNKIDSIMQNKLQKQYWLDTFNNTKTGELNTWDHQWTFAIWDNAGISILPNTNLVLNIGFGDASTHTRQANRRYSLVTMGNISHIIHPEEVIVDTKADDFTFNIFFKSSPTLTNRIRNFMYKNFPSTVVDWFRKLRRALLPSLD